MNNSQRPAVHIPVIPVVPAIFVDSITVGPSLLSVGRAVTIVGSSAAAAVVGAAAGTTTDPARFHGGARPTSAHLNHQVQPLKPTAEVVDEDDYELGLLWLPYLIFTVVLLALIALSFVRFHCQRGDQYRKRQEELEDKLPFGGNVTNGRQGAPPLVCDVPDHLSLFVKFTQVL